MVMRKYLLYLGASLMLFSCTKPELESNEPSGTKQREVIEVSFDRSLTKTALGTELDGKFPVVWSEGDEIAVLDGMGTEKQKYSVYRLKSGAGTDSGIFEYVTGDAWPTVIKDVIYPASAVRPSGVELDKVAITDVSQLIPSSQTYVKGSFDPDAAVMHYHNASNTESAIVLRPAAGVVCLQLKGKPEDVVTSVRLQYFDGKTTTVDLNCPDVTLSGVKKDFYIAVPPMQRNSANFVAYVNFKNGAVQVKTSAGKSFKEGELHRFPEWTMDRKSAWTILYSGSERDAATWHGIPMGPAKYMIDGNDLSWWEFKRQLNSEKNGPVMSGPHKFIIDLGKIQTIKGMKFKGKEKKDSPKYGITYKDKTGKDVDIYGSQSYNPPYNVKLSFATDIENPETREEIRKFKIFPESRNEKDKWKHTEEHHASSKNGIEYYYGQDMKKWWEFDLNAPVEARYIIMHISHGWNNAGTGSAASMLKVSEFDIY